MDDENPTREPDDGPVGVHKFDFDGRKRISIEVDGNNIACSPYNARRLLAMLSLILDLPLSKAAQKAIKF